MASYVLSGYTTPTGVNSASAVKSMQRELGVKADGIWGPNTQAAYNKSLTATTPQYSSYGNAYGSIGAYGGGAYGNSGAYGAQTGAKVYEALTPSNRQATSFTSATPSSAGASYDAGNRQAGYVEHASGYTGQGYRDEKGRYFTDYGALLREDGFFYPNGAIVSPNGMYYDNGNGWQYANHAKTSDGRYVASATAGTGVAPGSVIFSIDKNEQERLRQAAAYAYNQPAANTIEKSLESTAPKSDGQSKGGSGEWQDFIDREIELYKKKLFEGYGVE